MKVFNFFLLVMVGIMLLIGCGKEGEPSGTYTPCVGKPNVSTAILSCAPVGTPFPAGQAGGH